MRARTIQDRAQRVIDADPALAFVIYQKVSARKDLANGTLAKIGLTPQQRKLLGFIKGYLITNYGTSPSYDQMRAYLGLKSKSGIHRLVVSLEERGHIFRSANRARSIQLTPYGVLS